MIYIFKPLANATIKAGGRGRSQFFTTANSIATVRTEEVTMVDGKRDGTSKTTKTNVDGEEVVVTNCYNMGVCGPVQEVSRNKPVRQFRLSDPEQ